MNLKGMIVSIVTAMLVMTMFASTAMAITVDGKVDPAGEWDIYDEKINDIVGETCSTGYDITSLWMRVEDGTLFIRMDIEGVPGDADNDDNPDTYTNTDPATCGCPVTAPYEYPGVGVGADPQNPSVEEYIALIDSDNDGDYDYTLKYQLGSAALYDSDTKITDATVVAQHGGIVELSVKIDQYCNINPANYCVKGSADTDCNGNEDYTNKVCHFDNPPEARFDFTPTTCGGGTLDASASSDDVEIVSWAWDFCDDGTGDYDDAYGESIPYSYAGTCNVGLKVTDNLGQTGTVRHDVTVAGGPTVQVTTDADGCVEIGDSVTFSIDSLTNETPLVSYEWTFTNGIAGSGVLPWPPDGDVSITRTIPTRDGTKATLAVVDELGCVGADSVSVCVKPPQEVPLLTLPGLLALIGMMCIVGAGRIITKGRRS